MDPPESVNFLGKRERNEVFIINFTEIYNKHGTFFNVGTVMAAYSQPISSARLSENSVGFSRSSPAISLADE